MNIVSLRELAREILGRLEKESQSAAIDLLVTVLTKVPAGEMSRLTDELATARKGADVALDRPFAFAYARGRRLAVEQYDSPDNLALLDARRYAVRNERSINEDRLNGKLYALVPPGKIRGFRYPKWQFDAERDRLAAALRPFVDVNANCWAIHSFMMHRRESLQGRSPAEVILDSTVNVSAVVDLAGRDIAGYQGAQ